MSKKESNPHPSGTRPSPPPAPPRIGTDNSAVIRALEQRVEELEAVAEAAVVVHEQGPLGNFSEWEVLGDALRASGYLNE